MIKKTYWIIALMLLFAFPIQAQIVVEKNEEDLTEEVEGTNDDEEMDELDDAADDDDEVDDEEDEEDDEELQPIDAADDNKVVEEEANVEVPEALTMEVDSLLDLYHSQAYLEIDSTCNFQDVNPEYDKEVYIDRLKRLPTVMEMNYNDVVQKFIDRYASRLRRTVSVMLGAQNFYMPIFEQALETYGLPLELKYLPIIESALKPNAVSHVGATGLWQFMLATGRQYGLEINSLVDERRDPIKSSYAAARLLKALYKVFGDWNLVIAAYNCGPGNVTKAVHRAGGVKDYWQIYPYLPAETRGYVPAFIAANYIMNYYCEHNICPMRSTLPAKTDTIMINRDVHFEQISGVLGIDVKQIEELNPQYRRQIINGSSKPSILRLPMNYITQFIDNEDSIYAYRASELLTKRLVVDINTAQPTYTSSSKRYSRSKRGHYTRSKGRSTYRSKSRSKRGRSTARTVTVRKGDSLSKIAKRNGTTVAALKKKNGIKGNNIRAGKKLRVR